MTSRFGNRTRVTAYAVSGPVEFPEITVAELAAVLKYCLGGTPSGTSYPLADALPSCAESLPGKDATQREL